jgi:hypothetical protein
MATYLPKAWLGKRVAVVFRPEGVGLKGSLFSSSEGGVVLQVVENEETRNLFIPWSSVRHIELLEQADEWPPTQQVLEKPPGM